MLQMELAMGAEEKNFYLCSICNARHPRGFSHDEAIEAQRAARGYDHKVDQDVHKPGEYHNPGMDKAKDHADFEHPWWSGKALEFLAIYARHHREFSAAMVRKAFEDAKNPLPPTDRAWGSIFARARAKHLIRPAGFRYSHYDKPKSNPTPATWWASLVYEVGSELRAALGK